MAQCRQAAGRRSRSTSSSGSHWPISLSRSGCLHRERKGSHARQQHCPSCSASSQCAHLQHSACHPQHRTCLHTCQCTCKSSARRPPRPPAPPTESELARLHAWRVGVRLSPHGVCTFKTAVCPRRSLAPRCGDAIQIGAPGQSRGQLPALRIHGDRRVAGEGEGGGRREMVACLDGATWPLLPTATRSLAGQDAE
jgi:hypothetical protein